MDINAFTYVNIPEIVGNIEVDVGNLLLINGKNKTLEHVKAVATTNVEIAQMYGLDKNICRISGYLHDVGAVICPNDMLLYMIKNNLFIDEAEKKYPFILHQRISKLLAETFFNVIDKNILNAVECHSTLKPNPSQYDMALFIADKLSWDQEGIPPFYNIVKEGLCISLEKACLSYIDYIIDNNIILYPHSWLSEGKKYLEKVLNFK